MSAISKISLLTLVSALGFINNSVEEHFITTTPCNSDLRKLHNIPPAVDCSVINWDLKFSAANGRNIFLLKSTWGYFVDNWTTEIRGSAESSGTWIQEIIDNTYRITLTTDKGIKFSFRKLDLNHLHVLDKDGKLANGTDGYSFTLNKTQPLAVESANAIIEENTPKEEFTKTIFAGRTPCREIARESNETVEESCFKLKWKITFYQDSITNTPSRYVMNRIYHEAVQRRGTWQILTATINGRKETLYRLDPDKPSQSLTFMKGDGNVLFFLDKNLNFLPGSNEFSYTLNRR